MCMTETTWTCVPLDRVPDRKIQQNAGTVSVPLLYINKYIKVY